MGKTRKNLIKIMLAVCMFMFSFFAITTFIAKGEDASISDVHFESEYLIGSVVDIPDANLTYAGETKKAEKVVVYPSGSAYSLSRIVLKEAGKYTVEYKAKIAGKTVSVEKQFNAIDNLYSVSSKTASTVYDESRNSVMVDLPGGVTFTYNRVVDLTDNTKLDSLIDLFVVSSEDKTNDLTKLFVKLTDINDPSNYLCFRIGNEEIGKTSYMRVLFGAYVQGMIGNDTNGTGLEGTTIHKNNTYGAYVRFSFTNRGYYGDKLEYERIVAEGQDPYDLGLCVAPEDNSVSLRYDYESKQLYVAPSSRPQDMNFVVDFDDATYFDQTFKGFSDGKVILSVYGADYKKASATIGIKQIDGERLTSNNVLDDTTAPEISVDFSESGEMVPQGIVGNEYKVFGYSVKESYGLANDSVKVYYDYYSDNKISVSLKDGKFLPKRAGLYAIEYTAVDYAGNQAKRLIFVPVDEAQDNLAISVAQQMPSSFAGQEVVLPTPSISSNSIYGKTVEKITAKCGDLSVDVKNRSFIPMQVGDWEIVYTVENYAGQTAQCVKTLSVSNKGEAVFIDSVAKEFPHYYVSGLEYSLPTLYGYVFDNEGYSEIEADVKSIYNGTTSQLTNSKIVPQVNQSGDKISIVYYIGNAIAETIEIPVIIVKNNGTVDMGNLFAVKSGNVTISSKDDSIQYIANGDYSLEYVNKLISNDLEYNIQFNDSNIDTFAIRLTDVEDSSNIIETKLKVSSTGVEYISSGASIKVAETLDSIVMIKYTRGKVQINGSTFAITTRTDGKDFEGFNSSFVYLSVVTSGVKQGNVVSFKKLSNQPLTNVSEDFIAPSFALEGELTYYNQLNSTTIIRKAVACDVIDGECEVFVSVKRGNKYLTSVDGVLLDGTVPANVDYVVKLESFGNYNIVYSAMDKTENPTVRRMTVVVLDTVAPEVTVKGNLSDAKVGEEYTFNKYDVSDNLEIEELRTGIVVISEQGTQYNVKGGKFTFGSAGVWTVRIYAIDTAGNIGYSDYEITVR